MRVPGIVLVAALLCVAAGEAFGIAVTIADAEHPTNLGVGAPPALQLLSPCHEVRATCSGGTAPYTWTWQEGQADPPTGANVVLSLSGPSAEEDVKTYTITCTDGATPASTATATVAIYNPRKLAVKITDPDSPTRFRRAVGGALMPANNNGKLPVDVLHLACETAPAVVVATEVPAGLTPTISWSLVPIVGEANGEPQPWDGTDATILTDNIINAGALNAASLQVPNSIPRTEYLLQAKIGVGQEPAVLIGVGLCIYKACTAEWETVTDPDNNTGCKLPRKLEKAVDELHRRLGGATNNPLGSVRGSYSYTRKRGAQELDDSPYVNYVDQIRVRGVKHFSKVGAVSLTPPDEADRPSGDVAIRTDDGNDDTVVDKKFTLTLYNPVVTSPIDATYDNVAKAFVGESTWYADAQFAMTAYADFGNYTRCEALRKSGLIMYSRGVNLTGVMQVVSENDVTKIAVGFKIPYASLNIAANVLQVVNLPIAGVQMKEKDFTLKIEVGELL